jgi:predicted lipoprotein with Yx(FWY)xxD motif
MIQKSIVLASSVLVVTTAVAFADGHTSAPAATGQFNGETYLMDAHKMTLYTFDKDAAGVSNCYDDCAVKWPPLMGDATMDLPKGYSLIERKDGGVQVAYNEQPLYLWFKDKNPGDMTGDGVKGVWHIARP